MSTKHGDAGAKLDFKPNICGTKGANGEFCVLFGFPAPPPNHNQYCQHAGATGLCLRFAGSKRMPDRWCSPQILYMGPELGPDELCLSTFYYAYPRPIGWQEDPAAKKNDVCARPFAASSVPPYVIRQHSCIWLPITDSRDRHPLKGWYPPAWSGVCSFQVSSFMPDDSVGLIRALTFPPKSRAGEGIMDAIRWQALSLR